MWGSRSDVNLHHPQTATAGNTSGSGTAKYFWWCWTAGLIGFLAYINVSYMLGPSDPKYLPLTLHVKCVKPIFVFILQIPAFSAIQESRHDTCIIKLHLCKRTKGNLWLTHSSSVLWNRIHRSIIVGLRYYEEWLKKISCKPLIFGYLTQHLEFIDYPLYN